jgi:aminopeptidase S
MRAPSARISIAVLLLVGGCVPASDIDDLRASASEPGDDASSDSDAPAECEDLPAHITADGMLEHLEALEAIATANGNRRSVGSPGYEQSVAYVRAQLEDSGYEVKTHELDAVVAGQLVHTSSLFVETDDGDPDDVIMLGAHLDSVPTGPGINDNGSSVAALLEIADAIQGCATTRRVRFAWWGAEEAMLAGSRAWVESQDADELDAIRGYLNFDMIASPNYARFVFDGDGSAFDEPGPGGSDDIEEAFLGYFDEEDIATDPMGYVGRSDHAPFAEAGIAFGGIFTGADGVKTDEEAQTYGGQAGAPHDGCYHQACDDIDNVDLDVLEEMGRAIAYAVEDLAM